MKNKLFIILILAAVGIVVFYLIGPEKNYEEESYENPYSSICQKISKTNERYYCLAVVNDDTSFCERIDISEEREICMAMVNKDPSLCRDIQKAESRKFCFYELSEMANNIDYCDEAEDKEHCYFNFVANLHWASKTDQIKTEYCQKFSLDDPDRSTCFALKEQNSTLCEGVPACLTLFEEDLSFCEEFRSELEGIECIRDRAMIAEDPDICEMLDNIEKRDSCYAGYSAHLSPDVSLCDKVVGEDLRNMCYVEVAIHLAEKSEEEI